MIILRRVAALCFAVLAGCVANTPVNPSFNVTLDQAQKILSKDIANPKPLDRPLVIVGGFFDPGFVAAILPGQYRSYTHDNRVIGVSLGFSWNTEEYRRRIIDAVDKAFPSTDPTLTTEVDVIGYSMGGVAARYAAITPAPGRRLRIARLFTIASPHLGAITTQQLTFNVAALQQQMRPNSPFLDAINDSADPGTLYPVYSYVCLGDRVVGATNAAPPGQTPWWVSPPTFLSSHDWAILDPRIRADILCRLRDEPPLSRDPPTPLPPVPAKTPPR